jgi:Flp pilus assembly pilin Flp
MFEKIEKTKSKKSLVKDERGLSTVEYIILLVLIAVAGITIWNEFGDAVIAQVSGAKDEITSLGG